MYLDKSDEEEDKLNMVSIEKKHIRITIGVAVTILIFLIAITGTFAQWKTNVVNQIDHHQEQLEDLSHIVKELQKNGVSRDMQLVEIKTKLTNIEVLLIDIKKDIKS